MDAEEIMIGNYVWHIGLAKYIQVTSIHPDITDHIEGIKLNDKWLIEFGFNRVEHDGNELEFYGNGLYIYKDVRGRYYVYSRIAGHSIYVYLDFVHELQNFFFWMSSKEKLKLKMRWNILKYRKT